MDESSVASSPISLVRTPSTSSSTTSMANKVSKETRNPNDKRGRSTSCLLCQKRKQKCDHRLPSCTTCIKAGVECIQPLKYAVKTPHKDEYTVMLEKKVKFLEKIIDSNKIVVESKNKKSSFKFKKLSPFIKEHEQGFNGQSSSTSTITNVTQEQYVKSLVAKYNLIEYLTLEPIYSVDEQSSKIMLDMYFSRIQFKYPLLNEDELYDFHNTYINNIKASPPNHPSQNDLQYNLRCAKIFCIFAIGSVLYMSTNYKSAIKPEVPPRYFATSLSYLMECGDCLSNDEKVKMLNLIVLYLIRTDFDTMLLYDIVKDALNISVYKLNLNKSLTYQNLSFDKKQNYLRIWWCNYLLERSISISVGKPYSIPEYQIDEELPLLLKPFIIQSIKLRRIESKFVEFFKLSSIKQISNINLLKKLDEYFQLLEKWRLKIENNLSNYEMETLRLYYYRSIRILIQPFLEILDPNEKLFKECQAAAGQICQLFKKFHEDTVYGHSTTAINTVFNAGVTLIYCLWITRNKDDERRRALGDLSKHTRPQVSQSLFISMNDLRACSICLYVMTERSKFALIFRNIFDQLMFATINNLIERCGEDSSEIIYTNKPGMPPAIVRKYRYIPEDLEYNQVYSSRIGNDVSPSDKNSSIDDKSDNGVNNQVKYGLDPHINNLINNSKLYGDDKERMIKQNNLQRNIIPKSLSHLLINSPESSLNSNKPQTSPANSANDNLSHRSIVVALPTPISNNGGNNLINRSSSVSSIGNINGVDSPIPELQLDNNLKFPMGNNSTKLTSQDKNSLFLNFSTNTMISNISNWTEISGGMPIVPVDQPQSQFGYLFQLGPQFQPQQPQNYHTTNFQHQLQGQNFGSQMSLQGFDQDSFSQLEQSGANGQHPQQQQTTNGNNNNGFKMNYNLNSVEEFWKYGGVGNVNGNSQQQHQQHHGEIAGNANGGFGF